jgi:hypothetical protein
VREMSSCLWPLLLTERVAACAGLRRRREAIACALAGELAPKKEGPGGLRALADSNMKFLRQSRTDIGAWRGREAQGREDNEKL